jgi:hypothetical protein
MLAPVYTGETFVTAVIERLSRRYQRREASNPKQIRSR